MLTQQLPASARRYATQQRTEIHAAARAVKRLWSHMGADFDASYSEIEPQLLAVMTQAQGRIAAGSQVYVPAVMTETKQPMTVLGRGDVSPLIGVDGSGRSLSTLLYQSVVHAKADVGEGIGYRAALSSAGHWLTLASGTALSDTGRQSESLGMGLRKVGGYVRMLVPPSCSRCVILAGARYSAQTAFQRHPGCDCRNIPATESVADDLTVNPTDYFHSLTQQEQDATFGVAGSDAIRAGADVNQVVNARRGMSSVGATQTTSREMFVRKPDGSLVWEPRTVNVTRRQAQTTSIGGRDVLLTSEGTTRRGQAFRALSTRGGTTQVDAGFANRRTRGGLEQRAVTRTAARRPRLMPETIRAVATDDADYLRLLRANGYLR